MTYRGTIELYLLFHQCMRQQQFSFLPVRWIQLQHTFCDLLEHHQVLFEVLGLGSPRRAVHVAGLHDPRTNSEFLLISAQGDRLSVR